MYIYIYVYIYIYICIKKTFEIISTQFFMYIASLSTYNVE